MISLLIVSVFQKVLNKLMIFQQWNGSDALKLSAQDAFRKESKGEANRGEVITFLLKNDSFPRSVFEESQLRQKNLPKNSKLLQMINRLSYKFLDNL